MMRGMPWAADRLPPSRSHLAPLRPVEDRGPAAPDLPRPLTSFVGREREIAGIVIRLRDDQIRLLTLTGPGGVGKTRLAIRAAAETPETYPDGMWFVALAPVRDPALVLATIAHDLEIRESAMRSPEEAIQDILRDRRSLLILDNFEHLLDAAPLIADLLTACPSLTILATSRAVLRISGEHDIVVPPMSLPNRGDDLPFDAADGVRLFVERARAARDDFALTQENGADIAEVCRRLDGLPLAIELAAARVRHLPPRTLLNRLGQRLPLLTGGPRDQPARLRTMRQAIAWSSDLLSPAERILFRRLAVFVGGCTLEAAEEVGRNAGDDALELIASLADKSLLRVAVDPDGTPRYVMLETVREFASEQLAASGEADAIRRRHAAWCLALAAEGELAAWGGPEQTTWLDRFEAELANVRGALAWLENVGNTEAVLRLAAEISGLWFHRGRRAEGFARLDRALTAVSDATTIARAKALRVLATLGMTLGSARAVAHATECVALWTELGDAWRAADARLVLGMVLEHRADYERAAPLLEDVAAQLDALGEPVRAAVARFHLANAALECGDAKRAEAIFADVLALFRRGGYRWGVSGALLGLGQAAVKRGEPETAAALFARSLALAGNQDSLIAKLIAIASLAVGGGRPETAGRMLGAALGLAEPIGYVLRAPEQAAYQAAAAAARASLGVANFEGAWADGQNLSAEKAVAEATAMLAALCAQATPSTAADSAYGLTPRELEVLALVCAHLPDREIAERLFLSTRTVEGHVSHIIGKLGVSTRREVVAMAARLALVEEPTV